VPTVAAVLTSIDLTSHNLSSLRRLTNAGAALPPALAKKLLDKLPHARLYPMYGQTECIRVTYLPPEEVAARPGSVGRGMPNQELWLVDEEGRRLPPGSTGELVVRGAHVMRGYWKLTEATDEKLRPGPFPGERVLHTGDLFHMDADGWLTFIARKDDIIKTRGEKVSPKEVENVLYALPGVAEAAVVGVPDELLGQAVKAWVALRDDEAAQQARHGDVLDVKAVQRHCAAHLEDFAVPKHIEIVSELPKNQNGKIDKQALLTLGA
jgi:long-chain acyl-CoA synthetase